MPLFHSFERYNSIKLIIYVAFPLLIFIFFFNYKIEDSFNKYSPFRIEILYSSKYKNKEKEEHFPIKDIDFVKFRKLILKKYEKYSEDFFFSTNKSESSSNSKKLSNFQKYNLKNLNYEKIFEEIINFIEKDKHKNDDSFITYRNFNPNNIKKEIIKKKDKIIYKKNNVNNLNKKNYSKNMINVSKKNKILDNNNFDTYDKKNYKTNSVWNIIEKRALELDKYYNLLTENIFNLKEIPKIMYKITLYLINNNKNGNNKKLKIFSKNKREYNNTCKKRAETKSYKKGKNLILLGNTFCKIYLNKNHVVNDLVKYEILKRIKKKNNESSKNLEKNIERKHFIPIFKKYRNVKSCFRNDYRKINKEEKLKNHYQNISSKNRKNSENLKDEYEDENITKDDISNVKKIISKIKLNIIEGSNTSLNLLNNKSFQIDIIYDIRNNSMILLILYNKLRNNDSSSNMYKSELHIYYRSLNEFVENIISNSNIKNKIEQNYKKKFTNSRNIIFNNEITELKRKISTHYHEDILKVKNDLEKLRKYHKIYFNEHKKKTGLKKNNNFNINNKRKYIEKINETGNADNIKSTLKNNEIQEKNNYYERIFRNYIKNNKDIHFFLKDNISDKKSIINYLCNNNKNNDFYNFSNYISNYCESNVCNNPFYKNNSHIQKKFSKKEICKMLIYTYYDIVYIDKNIKLYEFLNDKKKLFYKTYNLLENKETNNRNKKLKSIAFLPFYILKYLCNIFSISYEIYLFIFNDIFQCYLLFIKYSFYYFFDKKSFLSMFNDLENFHPSIAFNIIRRFRFIYFLNERNSQTENFIKKKREFFSYMKNYLYYDKNEIFNQKELSDKTIFFDENNFSYEGLCNKKNEYHLFSYTTILCKIVFIIRYIIIYLIVSYNTLINIMKKTINNIMIIFSYILFCEKNKHIYKNNLLFNFLEYQIVNSYEEKVSPIKYIKSNNIYSLFFLYYLLMYKNINYYYNDSHMYSDYFTILFKYLKKEKNKNEEIKKNKEDCELDDFFLKKNNNCKKKINIYEKNNNSSKKNHVKYINHFINSNGWKHVTTIILNSLSSHIVVNKENFDFIIKYKTYINEKIVNRLIYFPLMNTNKLELFNNKIISIDENKIVVKYKENYKPVHKYILNIYKKMIKDREELKKKLDNNNKKKNVKNYYYNTNKVLYFYYNKKKLLKKENYINKINNYINLKKNKKSNSLHFSNRIKSVERKNTLLNMLNTFFFNKMKCLKNKNILKRNNSYYIELIKKKKSIYNFDEYLFYFFFYFSKKYYVSMNKKKHNFIKVNENNIISSIKNQMEIIKYIYFCIFTDLRDYKEKLNILKTIKYISTAKNMIHYIEENKSILSESKYILTHPFINIFIEFIINALKELGDLLSFDWEKRRNLENYIIYMNLIDLKIEQLYLYRQNLYNLKIHEIKQINFHKFILNYKKRKNKMKKKNHEREKYIEKDDTLDRDNLKSYQKKNHIQYKKNKKGYDMQNKIIFYEKEHVVMLDYLNFSFFSNNNYEINNELFKNMYAVFINKQKENAVYKFYLENKNSYIIRNIENYKDMILNYEEILKEKMKNLYRFKANLLRTIDLFLIKKKQINKYKKYEKNLKILKKEIFLIDSLNELNNNERVLFKNYLKENLFYVYEFPYISEISLLKLTNKRIYFGNKNDNKYICYGSVELSKLTSNYEKYKYMNKKIPQLPIEISIPNYNANKRKRNKNLKFFLIKEVDNNNEGEQIITISMCKYNNILRYYFNIYNIYNIINLTNYKIDFLISQFQKRIYNEASKKGIQQKGKWNYNIYKLQKNNNKNENYLVFYKNKLSEKRMNYLLKLRCIQKFALPANILKYSINLYDVISNINNTRNKKKPFDINQERNIFSVLSALTNYNLSSFFSKTNCANNFYEFSKRNFKNSNFLDLSNLQDFINNINENNDRKWINSDGNIIAFLKSSNLFLSLRDSETNKMSKPYYVSLDKLPELYKSLKLIHVSFFSIESYFPFLNVINQKNPENNLHKKLIFLLLTYEDGLLALIAVYDDSDNLYSYFLNKFKSFFTNTHYFFLQMFIYFFLYILEILRFHLSENGGNQFAQIYFAFLMLIDTILYPIFFFLYYIFNFVRKIFCNRINNTNVINNIDNDNIQTPINR
ncbi:hypothetical protein PRELSG_0211900 [Plasmodium relictum]|uniref:Uncharacterized protein n=1 Tax=Plasmodium relictum TaxID=85471 RepID=A0A1J1HDD8_PLARL|nr:hypothetical protein PRELSG_0211900 [Plasmodium relictum]CRH03094.1 hypothetical protein PRELSG_0211900 [Plasmodium relictum]